jgi:hypothetical protein
MSISLVTVVLGLRNRFKLIFVIREIFPLTIGTSSLSRSTRGLNILG